VRYSVIILTGLLALRLAASTPEAKNPPSQPTALDLQRESIRRQRDSLRQQLGIKIEATTAEFEFLTPPTPLIESDCLPLESSEIEPLIADAAKKQSLSPQLVRAVIRQESGFKPCAVSSKGAQGLMQLMPSTATQLHVVDPFDPAQNVDAGAAFLKQMLSKYNGDLALALTAYNAGSGRADQLDPSQYPLETQDYVARILAEVGTTQTKPAAKDTR
jgi:soluble lytic murein transglycosylase-like protein